MQLEVLQRQRKCLVNPPNQVQGQEPSQIRPSTTKTRTPSTSGSQTRSRVPTHSVMRKKSAVTSVTNTTFLTSSSAGPRLKSPTDRLSSSSPVLTGRTRKTTKYLRCIHTQLQQPPVLATTTNHPTSVANGPRSRNPLSDVSARIVQRVNMRMTSTTMRTCTHTTIKSPSCDRKWHSLVAISYTTQR